MHDNQSHSHLNLTIVCLGLGSLAAVPDLLLVFQFFYYDIDCLAVLVIHSSSLCVLRPFVRSRAGAIMMFKDAIFTIRHNYMWVLSMISL
jgi:hypothetical protein